MKAIVYQKYGSPDVLELQEVEKPTVADGEVLVQVHAASVNPLDWHFLRGTPLVVRVMAGLLRPKRKIPGLDVAGGLKRSAERSRSFGQVTRSSGVATLWGRLPSICVSPKTESC